MKHPKKDAPMRLPKPLLTCLWVVLLASPNFVDAHGFGERYDLPVPMKWITVAACTVILISFLWTPFLKPHASKVSSFTFKLSPNDARFQHAPEACALERLLLTASSALLALTWGCASFGSEDALMNFSPTFIWIVWWVGMSFGCMIFGNFWHKIDPWRGMYLGVQHLKEAFSSKLLKAKPKGAPARWMAWPPSWGLWPAALTLIIWCGLEIVYPIAAMPHRLGLFIALYSAYMWLGMSIFGPAQWSARADGFALYFEWIGQTREMLIQGFMTQPMQAPRDAALERSEAFCDAPLEPQLHLSSIAFGIAMFTSVLFDGLHAGQAWGGFEQLLSRLAPMHLDVNGYFTGWIGLIGLWLALLMMYLMTCYLTKQLFLSVPQFKHQQVAFKISTLGLAHSFLSGLIPIAAAYMIAHNFSAFFIQGQNIIALASDPFGFHWDLWGTAHFYPDISLIDAKVTWYVASISIVLGHVISIFMAHKVASSYSLELHQLSFKAMLEDPTLQLEVTTIKPWILNLPMTLVMIVLTCLSLSIIAEPLTNPPPGELVTSALAWADVFL